MESDKESIVKVYWKIGEVARKLCVTPSNVRFWTDNFGLVLHRRSKKLDRYFDQNELRTMFAIKYLIDKELYTLKGALIKFRLWQKGLYSIPEEYLNITTPSQTEALYTTQKLTRLKKQEAVPTQQSQL
jgi:DNA-binding transcriptional MerR regulator